jgi:DNA polymerase-1
VAKKLLIIDSFALIFRAYHAYPMLTTADGSPTNAIFGFMQMLLGSIEKFDPTHIACALESETPTFRHKLSATYKTNRKEPDNELQVQIPHIINTIQSLNITTLQKDGFEADDVIGSYAVQNQDKYDQIDIITGDRDLLQLISDKIHIFMPGKSFADLIEYDRNKFTEKFGIQLEDFVLYKTLIGDTSDNIKGVPGIGPKTAMGIVNQFHSLQSLLANTDQLNPRFALAIEENRDLLEDYYKLCQIDTGIDLGIDEKKLKMEQLNVSRLRSITKEYEFHSMSKRVGKFIDNFEKKFGGFGLFDDVETSHKSNEIEYSLSDDVEFNDKVFILKSREGYFLGEGKTFIEVKENDLYDFFIFHRDKEFIGFDLKPFIKILIQNGVNQIQNYKFYDLKLAWHLIRNSLNFEEINEIANYVGSNSCHEILEVTEKKIGESGVREVFELEKQVQKLLAKMEIQGVECDLEYLQKLEVEYKQKIQEIKKQIFDFVGHEFNPASTKELGHILFDVLKLPVFKKNKTGYSTDDRTLTKLEGMSEIIPLIKKFRLYSKMLSTYIVGLQPYISPEGKIHTTYIQDQVATGRLSSINPNLQNLPNDPIFGPMLRKAFRLKSESLFLSLDYSQIDLRVLAFESNDKELLDAFKNDEDIHTTTGKIIFEKEDLTKEERNFAKTINFGIVYGMEPYGLSQALNIDQKTAKEFIDKYLDKFNGVKVYFDKIEKQLDEKGYVQTFLGRRRYFDSWKSTKGFQKKMLFREAINMPIQGGTSEIMKFAMIAIEKEIQENNLNCELLLQIHDELILKINSTNQKEIDEITKSVKKAMENAYDVQVPLKVSLKTGVDLSFG